MKKYFFKINMSYTQKNKLYADFYEFVKSHDGTLLQSEKDKSAFKNMLKAHLIGLQQKHRRCKPILLSMGNYFSSNDSSEDISVSGSFTGYIYEVKETFKALIF